MNNIITFTNPYKDVHGHEVDIDIPRFNTIKDWAQNTKCRTDIKTEDEKYLIQLYQVSEIEKMDELKEDVFGVLHLIYEKYFDKCIAKYKNIIHGVIDSCDLMQQCLMGFIIGLMKYDTEKTDNRAHVYLSRYIAMNILKELHRHSGASAKPKSGVEKAKIIGYAEEEFNKEHGRSPSAKELSKITGMTYRSVVLYREMFNEKIIPLHEVAYDRWTQDKGSVIKRNIKMILIDKDDAFEENVLRAAYDELPDMQKKIIEHYYGLGESEGLLNVKKVSLRLKLTEGGVKVLKKGALNTLKKNIIMIKNSERFGTCDFVL